MLTNVDHAQFILTTITNAVKTSLDETTPETVIQFVCENGEVVTTDRSLVLSFSPFLRSIICSTPSSAQVISLPDASSRGVQGVLNMIGQSWMEDIFVLNKDQLEVLRILEIPVGDLENVQIVEFSMDDVHIQNSTIDESDLAEESENNHPLTSLAPKCPDCGMDFGDEDTKEELLIHIGEIHSEVELLAEFIKVFPGGSNKCGECGLEVNGEYVQKEHIMLQHPWPMLKATVEEISPGPDILGNLIENGDLRKIPNQQADKSDDVKQAEAKVSVYVQQTMLKVEHNNANSTNPDVVNNKVKGRKRGRKRKFELDSSESPVFSPYVPQRKSAKKASFNITKSYEGEKKYKQQNIGLFVKRTEPKIIDSDCIDSEISESSDFVEDIDKLLQDSDEEDYFGEDINYDASSVDDIASVNEIGDIQDHLEFSDSDEEEDQDKLTDPLTDEEEVEDDLPDIQDGIEFSDSDEDD